MKIWKRLIKIYRSIFYNFKFLNIGLKIGERKNKTKQIKEQKKKTMYTDDMHTHQNRKKCRKQCSAWCYAMVVCIWKMSISLE